MRFILLRNITVLLGKQKISEYSVNLGYEFINFDFDSLMLEDNNLSQKMRTIHIVKK